MSEEVEEKGEEQEMEEEKMMMMIMMGRLVIPAVRYAHPHEFSRTMLERENDTHKHHISFSSHLFR